jgi:alpha/beta superfamily hydrolase
MIPEAALLIGSDPVLESRLATPDQPGSGVVLCHPHPLYGGDMDNPVVIQAAKACLAAGVATLRFNFRGVGGSGGRHGDGVAEQNDVQVALDALAQHIGSNTLGIVGYSFGAWVGTLVGCRDPRVAALALIAPPLALYDFGCLDRKRVPTLIIGGDRDSYCPAGDLTHIADRYQWVTPIIMKEVDHFFVGALEALGGAIGPWARALAASRHPRNGGDARLRGSSGAEGGGAGSRCRPRG